MTGLQFVAHLVDAVVRIVSAVAWPVVVVLALRHFEAPLGTFIKGILSAVFKGFGLEVSITQRMDKIEGVSSAASGLPEPPGHELPDLTPKDAITAAGGELMSALLEEASRQGKPVYIPTRTHPVHGEEAARNIGFSASDTKAILGLLDISQDLVHGGPRDVTMEEYVRYRKSVDRYLKLIADKRSAPQS